ncbi:cbb3-type cytochrome c oxidase subunit II [uncultured Croceitalea sp.]|uniref:cbb3-type cytochrome c oxidase subunit II n=1 Tax=uncultured Croceitalea sp. TaxID=1798908 RepID=UPI0033062809
MLNLSKNHALLTFTAFIVFFGLSTVIAIFPALDMQNSVQPLSKAVDLSPEERAGLNIYIAEGCVACHTQQVRNIEMDKVWGDRPSLASDYYYSKKRMDVWRQSPSLLGSERTGPDLTNVGKRQPSQDWHLIHLYNPRIVVEQSVMAPYPWLFELKSPSEVEPTDVKVNVPKKFLKNASLVVVAKDEALNLVKYIQSLKQVDPSFAIPDFIPSSGTDAFAETTPDGQALDGKSLYIQNCAACHQPSGEGLAGAFPTLKNSPIVIDEDYDFMVRIIIQGYDARDEYGVMPPLGDQLNDSEIAAIVNYERNSWGNEAARVSTEDVKRIRDFVNALNQ